MAYRSVPFVPGEFYHIYNRGNSKQDIFRDQQDMQRFQQLLYLANVTESISFRNASKRKHGLFSVDRQDPVVAIGAYCLMKNHYHLLVTPIHDNGVSIFMQRLSTAYVMYFNKKYDRVGSLFEGLFRAKHADTDQYLKYLFAYIHLNPSSKVPRPGLGTKDQLQELVRYPYSSLSDYIHQERDESLIVQQCSFPDYFPTKFEQLKELEEWLQYEEI